MFGPCTPGACPSAFAAARSAVEAGLVLHAEHPNFGGVLTVGPYRAAVEGRPFAMIGHGCGVDLDQEFETSTAALRGFVFQVGERAMAAAALSSIARSIVVAE